MIAMTNLEVARCFIGNAISYGKSNDLPTVMANLEFIQLLLENPDEENDQYDWDDFK